MKKVLLCERNTAGHRKTYLKWLSSISDMEMFVYAPQNVGMDSDHFIPLEEGAIGRGIGQYWRWMKSIRKIVREKGIDTVHFLDGDSIMRFMGLGFTLTGAKRIIITYHHFFEGFARKISYRMMNRGRDTVSVVHTDNVRSALIKVGIKNVAVCQYPAFDFESLSNRDPAKCKERYQLARDIPVIGIIGGMCHYKNIIPFLNVMKDCTEPFHLLICGSPSDITETEILEAVAPYSEKVTAVIRHLSEEEYKDAIVASDIIFCIYGHEFDGASGPLTDGVCAQKMILSCKHGSLGEIVFQKNLGIAVACDDGQEIIRATELALKQVGTFAYNEKAKRYRTQNKPECFLEKYLQIYKKED